MTTRRIVTVLALLALMLSSASPLWAESNVPDPALLFADIVNPNAKGTKVSGSITIAYDGAQSASCDLFLINNMFVVLTVGFNSRIQPFNTDFSLRASQPFCFDDQNRQETYITDFITAEVIPALFGCGGSGPQCPSWEIKSITNFTSSGKQADGAIFANIVLAVH